MRCSSFVGTDLTLRLSADVDGAFDDVMVAYGGLVHGVALRLLGDRHEAEDAAQEAFVRAYRALCGYPAERIAHLRLAGWLAAIALNEARNRLRGRRRTDGIEAADGLSSPDGDGPAARAERRDEQRLWARLLASLPPRYREAVALRHVEGLSYAEVAEALARPVGTVKSDVHRGVAALRAAYEAERMRDLEAVR